MRACLDNTIVATSSNAVLQYEITTAQVGTDILTIQGWDEDGTEYLVQGNINIDVKQ